MRLKPEHSWSASTTTTVSPAWSAKRRATPTAASNSSVSPMTRSASMRCDCLSMWAPSTISTKPFSLRDRTESAAAVISSSMGWSGAW